MSDTTTWLEGSVEESLLSAIVMEIPPSQQQYYLNDNYFDIDIDEILNINSPPGSPEVEEVEDTENQTTAMSTTTITTTTHNMSTTTATTTTTSPSTTAHEEPTLDTSEDQAPNINREARAKASKDRL